MELLLLIVAGMVVLVGVVIIAKSVVVVPQQSAYVVERLGKYAGTLHAGFHTLTPFFDVIRYRHTLKESAIDIPEQICITKDNVQVGVDGVIYMKVVDPERASYGISNYVFAITQLAQTALRSEIGKIDLDRTFEERTTINTSVVNELDQASEPWGVKVLRYEIKNITPPAGRSGCDGKADAGRTREARRDSAIRGYPRFEDQHGRGCEAGDDQELRSKAPAADQ